MKRTRRNILLGLLAFVLLVAVGKSIQTWRTLNMVLYDTMSATQSVRDYRKHIQAPIPDSRKAYLAKRRGLVIEISPQLEQGRTAGVRVRSFRKFNMRLETEIIYPLDRWLEAKDLYHRPDALSLTQAFGLQLWYKVAALTGASARYTAIVQPPGDSDPLD